MTNVTLLFEALAVTMADRWPGHCPQHWPGFLKGVRGHSWMPRSPLTGSMCGGSGLAPMAKVAQTIRKHSPGFSGGFTPESATEWLLWDSFMQKSR